MADFEASEWHWVLRRSWWIWDCYAANWLLVFTLLHETRLCSFSACLGRFLLWHRSDDMCHARWIMGPSGTASSTQIRRATHLGMSISAYVRTVHMYVYIYTYICTYIWYPPQHVCIIQFWRFDGTAKSILSMTFSMTVASGTSASLAIAAFQIIRTASPYWTLSNPNVLKKFLGKTLPESHCGGLLGVWGHMSHIQQSLSNIDMFSRHPGLPSPEKANHQLSCNPKPSPQPGGDAASKAL